MQYEFYRNSMKYIKLSTFVKIQRYFIHKKLHFIEYIHVYT